jgi:hypothetical protein
VAALARALALPYAPRTEVARLAALGTALSVTSVAPL